MEGVQSIFRAIFLYANLLIITQYIQCLISVCSFPVYRHPADESPPLLPFSPTVALIREHVQRVLAHPVNHVLIQFYRTGRDHISEHSDKTIDVVRGSNIVNVSLGAQRVMTLRSKKDAGDAGDSVGDVEVSPDGTQRVVQRIPLPHNSMFVMGPETNKRWLHGINHDNRPLRMKTDVEKYEGGGRISLTFRHIGTFLTKGEEWIYGQGATGKTLDRARRVISGTREAGRLIGAFGKENQESEFDWEAVYGRGFDVLHFPAH
jgi:alkylated DNA repair dioxygenase AlkB